MSIQRFEAGPRMSQCVVHGNTVYRQGRSAQGARGASVAEHTQDIRAIIDKLLHAARDRQIQAAHRQHLARRHGDLRRDQPGGTPGRRRRHPARHGPGGAPRRTTRSKSWSRRHAAEASAHARHRHGRGRGRRHHGLAAARGRPRGHGDPPPGARPRARPASPMPGWWRSATRSPGPTPPAFSSLLPR